jgi:hypothetical protein
MPIIRLIAVWIFSFIAVASFILPVAAHEKTDIVILKNGDRVTCEIKNLARGLLTVGTDSMGTISIKWQDVERITSKFFYTIQDTRGRVYVGTLKAAADARRVDLSGPREAENLDHMSIVTIQELEGSLWRRFSGTAELGYSFTKASNRTQLNFEGDVQYHTEHYTGQLTYSTIIGTSNGQTDSDRKLLTLAGSRQLSGKWLAYSQVSFEHNLELQLDRRFGFLVGPGYSIVRSQRSMVTAVGAAAFSRESYFGEDTKKNVEGFFAIDAQFFKLYSPKVDITNRFAYLPNFTTWGRRRFEFNTNARFEIFKDFFFALTFYDSYDSKPPASRGVTNDYGFTTGLSWSFRR